MSPVRTGPSVTSGEACRQCEQVLQLFQEKHVASENMSFSCSRRSMSPVRTGPSVVPGEACRQ